MPSLLDNLLKMSLEELVDMFPTPPEQIPSAASSENARLSQAYFLPPMPLLDDTFLHVPFDSELLLKGCRGDLSPAQTKELRSMMFSLSRPEAADALTRAYEQLYSELNEKRKFGASSFSKFLHKSKRSFGANSLVPDTHVTVPERWLDFGLVDEYCPLHEPMVDKITIITHTGKSRFRFMPINTSEYSFSFNPEEGILKKKEDLVVTVTMVAHATVIVRELLCLEVEGIGRFFFLVKLRSESSEFGMPIERYLKPDGTVIIPPVLLTLREEFMRAQGYLADRIFSVAADETETLSVKDQLNRNVFYECKDVHVLGTLIKEWYRELPTPLLIGLDIGVFMESENAAKCVQAFESLNEPAKSLFSWLLDLMCDVVAHTHQNGMSAQNLATVMAPNLFAPSLDEQYLYKDQEVDLITLSLKIVHFVQQLITHRASQRAPSLTHTMPTPSPPK